MDEHAEGGMKCMVLDRSKAPEPPRPRASKNAVVYDQLVASVMPGKAACIEPDPNETLWGSRPRSPEWPSAGIRVRGWERGNVVYAELMDGASAE